MFWRVCSTFLLLLLLLSGVGFIIWLHEPTTFPIKTVRIEGNLRYLDQPQLQQTLTPLVSGGFFSIDVTALHHTVSKNPWVESVVIRRVWPDAVALTVLERQPVARWKQSALIDRHGYSFPVDDLTQFRDLPLLVGPDGQSAMVWRQWQSIDHTLKPLSLKVRQLTMTSRQALDVELSNGLLMRLGVTEHRERLARFVKMYPAIARHHPSDLRAVDLRYSNGIAVAT